MTIPMVPPSFYLILSAILFTLGAVGVLIRRNALVMFMSVEMMLNAVNLTLITYSRLLESVEGQVFVLLVMAVAAAEVAVGLAIVVAYYRHKETTDVDEMDLLKW
jgi:NADH-quinone oxidoreductase subunit K